MKTNSFIILPNEVHTSVNYKIYVTSKNHLNILNYIGQAAREYNTGIPVLASMVDIDIIDCSIFSFTLFASFIECSKTN